MNSRKKVLEVFTHKNNDHGVMWTGNPHDETVEKFAKEWGIEPTKEAVFSYLNDDCRWIAADAVRRRMLNNGKKNKYVILR